MPEDDQERGALTPEWTSVEHVLERYKRCVIKIAKLLPDEIRIGAPSFEHAPVESLEWILAHALIGPQRYDPVPMIMHCPAPGCGARHIDEGEFATRPHHTHACQTCGFVWRPAIVHTVGVQFLPGFKNER
jgi:hypothetical protein